MAGAELGKKDGPRNRIAGLSVRCLLVKISSPVKVTLLVLSLVRIISLSSKARLAPGSKEKETDILFICKNGLSIMFVPRVSSISLNFAQITKCKKIICPYFKI
jgi:hypothetical protein